MTLRPFFIFLGLFLLSPLAFSKGAHFIYCSEASPKVFNPQLATDGPTFNASSRVIYSRLVEFKSGGTEIEPGLATSWTVSKDGLKYNFKLRKNVQFHTVKSFKPTRAFNADDVIWTFNRMRVKTHPYYKVGGGTYEYFRSMGMDKLIKDIKKVGEHEIQFVLSRREAPFLSNMAMDFASILSKEYGDVSAKVNKKSQVDRKAVGTGPFYLTKYVEDTVIKYKSHPKYYKGEAKLKRLIFSITPDASVRFQKLKRGECHLIAEPSPIDIALMKKNPKIQVKEMAGLNVGYLAFNVEKKPLNKLKVRQAIRLALDRDSYIKAIYKGYAEVAKNPIPPTIWSYNNKISRTEKNIKKAKALLAEAGHKDGFEVELWTLPVSRPYNPNGRKMGELMMEDLKKIGIKVKLKTYKWATYLEKSAKGEHEMVQLGWTGDNGDPDNFLSVLLGCDGVKAGSNYARWCNKKFDKLVVQAKSLTSKQKREELYKKAQSVFKEQVPWVPIAHSKVFRALDAKVKGYKMSPFGTESFYHLSF